MGLWRGRLWCPVVPLLWAAAVGSIVYCVDAQADPVHRLKGAEVGKAGSNLSPIQNQIHEELQADHDDFGKKGETRLKQKNKEAPIAINPGLHGLEKASKRRVISKREAKKPKNTKRRVKFNKKELEKKLQQQEKEGSDLKTKSKEDSRVDTSEVLSSSNSLIPESGKKSSGSSSTYESYSESSDSDDENDIDDDDDEEDESIDASSDASDDKTEPTEEISLTSEQEKSKESKEDESSYSSLSTIQHSGPESSPPASSDSTDESSGSRAIPKSSSEYSEISYTMSSSAEDAFPVEDSSVQETKEKEVDTSKAASKSKEKSKSVKSTKKAKLMTKRKKKTGKGMKSEKFKGAKGDKNKIKLTDEHKNLVKESHANVEEQKSKTAETISQHLEVTTGKVLNVEKHENVQKLTEGEKLAQRLEITTGRVLNVKKNLDKKINHELQGTTEKVLRMSQNTVQKKVASRNVGMNPSSNKRTAMSDDGILPASKERPGVELLKVKKAEIDPKKKADLEQELIKDYPENGTVEIVNWQGTFAPIHGEPYVAPLHHQPDEFWDAIYTSKDPDLPTPPGAGISGETTAYPLPGPHMDMHRLAGMPNHQTYNQPDPSHFGRNPNTDHQPDPSGFGNNNNIEAKEKDKGEKNEKKKAKLTIKEKRKKKKEKKENPRESVKYAGRAEPHLELIPVKIHGKSEPHVEQVPVNIHNNNNIEAKDKDKEKKNDKKKAKLTIKEKRKKKKEKKENPRDSVKTAGKSEPPIEHVPVNIHAKEKSEENLKTPSEEERESGTTYKPEGAYDYPYFRHPDFNPDTAYDEHGIPIHESPGWTPPPTLPGDNRFGKGRNQAGAGLKNRVNGPLALPQVAKLRRAEPKRLAVSVGGFHPEEKLGNNVHETQGLQDHMALLEHQNVLEGLHGLKFDPLHPLGSLEHLNLPLQHKEDMGKNNVNHRIKKRKASRSESVETSESSSEELDSEDIKVSPQVHQDQETAKERAYGGTTTTRLTKQAWLKNVTFSRRRPTAITRPSRKEPYTGFLLTQRPRWYQPRGHARFEYSPVPPPHQIKTHPPSHPTRPSSMHHLHPPTTSNPHTEMESSTQWWPPGVSLGSRPPISRIPIHVIYPEIAKWEMNWKEVKVRTSGTRYTYAPEVENYPVTFDWNVPRHLRTDKWTQRPDWPLESPLFSSEAYDYLEEPTLPRILESGETEYPPTSPLPWWTYPPWWLEKKALETINGTTPRPYMRKTPHTLMTTFSVNRLASAERVVSHKEITTNEHKNSVDKNSTVEELTTEARFTTEKIDLVGIKKGTKIEEVKMATIKMSEETKTSTATSHEASRVTSGSDRQQTQSKRYRKTHHKGPWWHLTIVEHLTPKPDSGGSEEEKRAKRSPKLVRQNAFRRKWKKLRQRKNLSHTLDLQQDKPWFTSERSESSSLKRVLSNFTFIWPKVRNRRMNFSKVYLEDILTKALDELKEHLTHVTVTSRNHLSKVSAEVPTKSQTDTDIEKHLTELRNLFLTTWNNFSYKQSSDLLFHIFTNEIGREIGKHLLNHTNLVRQLLDRLLFKRNESQCSGKQFSRNYLEKSTLINLYKLFCMYDLIHYDISKKIINIFKSLYGRNIDFLNHNSNGKYSFNVKENNFQSKSSLDRKVTKADYIFKRKKRENIIDRNEHTFNLSAQSVENVVGEIVNEIVEELPVDEINKEVKTEVLTAMHENQLKRLGKTNINRDVLREMAKLETVDEAKFRNATEDSVRRVIMKMVNEVVNILRQTPWMKDLMIKLFNEGYSVDSVLETISNQVSIEELMNSMEKDGINITRYQKKLVLEEFKDYKSTLRKILTQEVQLWEYQLAKNQTLIRHRRDVTSVLSDKDHTVGFEKEMDNIIALKEKHILNNRQPRNPVYVRGNIDKDMLQKNNREIFLRMKRDVNDNEISKSLEEKIAGPDTYDENDMDIDRELAELKKSSMSKREKMKVLRIRLKGLMSQTENPDDIVFPDNFEEELMRTEHFYDEVTQSPQRFKQRVRWNVRTKKPTTKVITYPMKIRLNRGRPFVPLTTTEEQTLIMVVTQSPSRKYRTARKALATKKVATAPSKKLVTPSPISTPELERQFWLDLTTIPTDTEPIKSTQKIHRATFKPVKTYATLRTFKTMKFVQKTQQPVISLQEFLKRRNEFRREKQGEMFNRPWSEEDKKPRPKGIRNLSDLSEEEGEFTFEAKLSGEISPSVFTLPPPITTEPTKSIMDKPSLGDKIRDALTKRTTEKSSQKVTRKNISRGKSGARSNKTRTRRPATRAHLVTEKSFINFTTQVMENEKNENYFRDGEPLRRKRDLPFPHYVTDSTKAEGDFSDVTITPLVLNNEKLRESKKNISQISLEGKINFHNWSYSVNKLRESKRYNESRTDSFETYQQEHRKWFGTKKRGVPVNNFDIDWEQMRRKMEIDQLSAWQRQKSSVKPTFSGKQSRKSERATPLTQATTPIVMGSSEKPSNLLDNLYKSALKKKKPKSFAKYYISDESIDSRQKGLVSPPFGKIEKDGHTPFGRLYQGKRHYQVEDLRDKYFHEDDLQQLINKTYDPAFRISTHRKSNWSNRTFDPNYVFTQFVPLPEKTKTKTKWNWKEATLKSVSELGNPSIPPEADSFLKILKTYQSTIKPNYKMFLEEENVTEVVNRGNETYVLTRSKRVPWENNTDIEAYKVYIRSRKRFYNKTLDIAFSYYISHKFRCGNKTRDLGYGRMSNVVNRWYNRTFVPKYRPDMFYIRNRYKRGKEFNYFKDEMNEIHAIISYGEFDPLKWMQVATDANLEESSRTAKIPSDLDVKEELQDSKKKKTIIEVFSSYFPLSLSTRAPETNLKLTPTIRWKERCTSGPTKVPTTKASFFQSVKEKGFGFFRSLFGKQDSGESKD